MASSEEEEEEEEEERGGRRQNSDTDADAATEVAPSAVPRRTASRFAVCPCETRGLLAIVLRSIGYFHMIDLSCPEYRIQSRRLIIHLPDPFDCDLS
jgi:hypothetical protein